MQAYNSQMHPDISGYPPRGKPGLLEWEALTEGRKRTINNIFVNMGKAIAAFERKLTIAPTRFDRWELTDQEKRGALRAFEIGCINCHHGKRFTDDSFHANYFATGRQDCFADKGRELAKQTEFTRDSLYSDSRANNNPPIGDFELTGKFKTPSLRNISKTAPYTHGGQIKSLAELIKFYCAGGLPDGDPIMMGEIPKAGCPVPRPPRTQGTRDIGIVRCKEDSIKDAALVAFLETL